MRPISSGTARRAHLFDIQTVEGLLYYWADAKLANVPAAITANNAPAKVAYQPWVLTPPRFSFHRSMQTDTGSFTVQNVSGNTVARDFETAVRRSAMEGALFAYRWYNTAAQVADLTVLGTLTVDMISASSATLNCQQLFSGQDDVPGDVISETCQLVWAERRCQAQGTQECLYSFRTCQVVEHFTGVLTMFEKNYGEALPDIISQPVNRRRAI